MSLTSEKHIAIISASGIGNTILFTPALIILRKIFPKAIIDLIVRKDVFGECVRGSGLVDAIHVIPEKPKALVRFIWDIHNHYDISITAFPSNKWQFNLFAFLLGAKIRITHSYAFGKKRTLSFLQNFKVPADPTLHDVYQNINLIRRFFNGTTEATPKLLFYLSAEDSSFAEQYLQQNNIGLDVFIIGVHAGAGPLGNRKKWGISNFACEIRNSLKSDRRNIVILFGGTEETQERKELSKEIKGNEVLIFNGSLRQSAALISKCDYFISNDTGLMHVAACFGIKQKSIFISTNPIRTASFNNNATIQIEGDCMQYKYPFWSTKE